jgi:4-hydroxybenzoate polyprenyltransferase
MESVQSLVSTPSKFFDWSGFWRLIRWQNLVILLFTQYFIKIFLISNDSDVWMSLGNHSLAFICVATLCIAAAGYIINDYYDVKIDTVNKPSQVVIGKLIKRRVAMFLHTFFNFSGIAIGFLMLNEIIGGVLFASAFLLWLYSNQLKRLPLVGNLAISLLTAMSVLIVSLYFPDNQNLVWVFALFAFFSTLIREIVKDMEDVKGDETFGCRTLPILWGIRRTKQVIYVFFGVFFIILLSTYLTFAHQFVFYLYLVEVPLLIWFLLRLYRADTKKDFRFLSQLCKWIMIMGVLSVVFV